MSVPHSSSPWWVAQRGVLKGRWGNEWGSYGFFELSYSDSYEWPDAWMSLLQFRELSGALNGVQIRWIIGSDGQINGGGKTGLAGEVTSCDYASQAVQRDPRFNQFDIEYTASGCPLSGHF